MYQKFLTKKHTNNNNKILSVDKNLIIEVPDGNYEKYNEYEIEYDDEVYDINGEHQDGWQN